MADTAHKTADELREYYDDEATMAAKAEELANLIRDSKHFIAFTGAGISTACGIPDFRGPDGVWTLRAQKRSRTGKTTASTQAIPSKTHMALVELMNQGYLKGLISQNTDGLHRKSGIDETKFAELHGCTNLEKCKTCGQEFLRDFRTRTARGVKNHATGRTCTVKGCGGDLHDSIINFGENLPDRDLNLGFEFAEKSDLCLVLGSSLRVTPAADMPETVANNGGTLAICNLQKTPQDSMSRLRVNGKCDDLMERVMANLGLEIPEFRLRRHLVVRTGTLKNGKSYIRLEGVDAVGNPYEYFRSVTVSTPGSRKAPRTLNKEPFRIASSAPAASYTFELEFMGHYKEPKYTFEYEYSPDSRLEMLLAYSPYTREWAVEAVDGDGAGGAAGPAAPAGSGDSDSSVESESGSS